MVCNKLESFFILLFSTCTHHHQFLGIDHNATEEQLAQKEHEDHDAFLKKYERRIDTDGFAKPGKPMQYKGFTIVDFHYTTPRCVQVFMGRAEYTECFDPDRCIAVLDYDDNILKSKKVVAPWLTQEVDGCKIKISPFVDHSLVLILLGMMAVRFSNMHYMI